MSERSKYPSAHPQRLKPNEIDVPRVFERLRKAARFAMRQQRNRYDPAACAVSVKLGVKGKHHAQSSRRGRLNRAIGRLLTSSQLE